MTAFAAKLQWPPDVVRRQRIGDLCRIATELKMVEEG